MITNKKAFSALLDEKIVSAVPVYTGGGIWCFFGKTETGKHFYAYDSDAYEVYFLKEDPLPTIENEDGNGVFCLDWLEKNTIACFCDVEPVKDWFLRLYAVSEGFGGFDKTDLRLSIEEITSCQFCDFSD